jgi:hypothetical protein
VKALLERARGSPLDISTRYNIPVDTIELFLPHTRQIRSLTFRPHHWSGIERFSKITFGPLPLLRTLEISAIMEPRQDIPYYPKTTPLFSNAVNLERFILHSQDRPLFNHFVFPNLTTFELSTTNEFQASGLLDFLEASPMLRTVHMIIGNVLLEDVAQGRVVVLPNVQTFSLVINDGVPDYELTAYISCPSASHTSLTYKKYTRDMTTDRDILMFPTVTSWNTIVRQYTRSPVEVVTLEIGPFQNLTIIGCTLTFQSPDMNVIKLGLEVYGYIDDENEFQMSLEEMVIEVFSQASRTVRDHPPLHNIKRLHIGCEFYFREPAKLRGIANGIGRLFGSVGPLDELTIRGFDLRSYLAPFLDLPEFQDMDQPIVFPPIKELTISHPMMMDNNERMAAIVELAKSQHALGVPFERVTICPGMLPAEMVEMLESWVSVADC